MKKNSWLLFIIIAFIANPLHAQVYNKKTLQSGESIADKSYYLFPAFTNASVRFKKGGLMAAKMNFNLLICTMQFINTNNDTLEIKKPDDIDSIIIDSNVFFFNKGYYEILLSAGTHKLAVLRKATFEPVKVGAMGLPTHTEGGIDAYNSFESYVGERSLIVNEDVEITAEADYFLINKNNELVKADKAGFIKTFPDKEANIQTYLKQTRIKLNKEEDFKKLFSYCTAQ